MKNKLTCSCSVILDSSVVPLEEMEEKQIVQLKNTMHKRLSNAMSDYYSLHPKEYAAV